MKEKIYTIPVNDAFDKKDGCPVCSIYEELQKEETEKILGASMMEPAVRIETNKKGFCHKHFDLMYKNQKRLPLALILDSHIETINESLKDAKPEKQADYLKTLKESCYICDKLNWHSDRVYSTILELFSKEKEFREKAKSQPLFCLNHYKELVVKGKKQLSKKDFEEFFTIINNIEKAYLNTLSEDVKWFSKKFDYRNKDEDWKNSKDALERAVYTLTSEKIK